MKPGIPYIDRWTSGCRSAPMGTVSLGPNTSKAQTPPRGVTYLGDANDSVVRHVGDIRMAQRACVEG